MAEAKIRIRGLKKRFGAKVVLDGVDLDVEAGKSLVVIGGSGTGKSVLIKCILGLIEPDSGSIQIDGVELIGGNGRKAAEARRQCGMLFQGGALFDSQRIWENVAFRLLHAERMKRGEARDLAIATLKRVGLNADVADLMPAELSGGMQKRVGLARAIASKPSILFFDEPTTGLDPIMADVINQLIRDATASSGVSALSITHDMASVRHIGDTVAMLYAGRIHWRGPVGVIDNSGDDHVDQFVKGHAEGPMTVETAA
ncbi:MAG: ATP-binding cassette domain-containing protein [Pseudomonadota bacterium]